MSSYSSNPGLSAAAVGTYPTRWKALVVLALAQVVLTLDNTDRTAPAGFNDSDVIEISRRIERESGSSYKLNGREVRARDVQLLFADASAGSRSPAMSGIGGRRRWRCSASARRRPTRAATTRRRR